MMVGIWLHLFLGLWGILGSASGPNFYLSGHVGFTLRLLYSSTHHCSLPRRFYPTENRLSIRCENRYFYLDISRWHGKHFVVVFWAKKIFNIWTLKYVGILWGLSGYICMTLFKYKKKSHIKRGICISKVFLRFGQTVCAILSGK